MVQGVKMGRDPITLGPLHLLDVSTIKVSSNATVSLHAYRGILEKKIIVGDNSKFNIWYLVSRLVACLSVKLKKYIFSQTT